MRGSRRTRRWSRALVHSSSLPAVAGATAFYVTIMTAGATTPFTLVFDQSEYDAVRGSNIAVQVMLDPVPDSGLFSFGVKLMFDPGKAAVSSSEEISVPPELDFNGILGMGAQRAVGDGFAGVKGTVDFFADPLEFYHGGRLATFVVSNRTEGPFTLELEIYRTLGSNENVFIDGRTMTLDPQIAAETAEVIVRPKPGPRVTIERLQEPGQWILLYPVDPEHNTVVEWQSPLVGNWNEAPGAPHNDGFLRITNLNDYGTQAYFRLRVEDP